MSVVSALRALHRRLGLKYHFDRAVKYARRFGVGGAVRTYRALRAPAPEPLAVHVPGIAHALAIRPATADVSTLEKIFVWNQYALDYPPRVATIVDAGANIGLASVFFATRFPEARVIALEPEAANFELLRRNTEAFPKIVPLHAALWSCDTTIGLSNPNDRVDSYRFNDSGSAQSVHAFDVPSLLQRFDLQTIDVLKIDIEGAETEVFAASADWIHRVRMFIVELHDDAARRSFADATASLNARRYQYGENDIVIVSEPA